MKITFKINYRTSWGQNLFVVGSAEELGSNINAKALPMKYEEDGNWSLEVEVTSTKKFTYNYLVLNENKTFTGEYFTDRAFAAVAGKENYILHDTWRSNGEDKTFYSSAFTEGLILRTSKGKKQAAVKADKVIQFSINAPRVEDGLSIAVVGGCDALGNWDTTNALVLSDAEFPLWKGAVALRGNEGVVEYKYVLYNAKTKTAVSWEYGDNRTLNLLDVEESTIYQRNDEVFRYSIPAFKCAGVSIPVFSIRTHNSFGVGEFSDLKLMSDWAKLTGQRVIQTLPITDTTRFRTNADSYPYSSITVMALHPIYINIFELGILKDEAKMQEFYALQKEFNASATVKYQEVTAAKWEYFNLIYKQEGAKVLASAGYKKFLSENKEWLYPYAAFCYLRDKYNNCNFRVWEEYSVYNKTKVGKLFTDAKTKEEVNLHLYLQYNAHLQLLAATQYANQNNVVVKGDIPIGISPESVEAWMEPELFNLDSQAGAPPDPFSKTGQNWGFPTYNWEEMERDGYLWWKKRFQKMATYFQVYRIDHVLGFFRIWRMNGGDVQGLLGYFDPALPFAEDEIKGFGTWFDYNRMVNPYIREHMIYDKFGSSTPEIMSRYLELVTAGSYRFKEEFKTQRQLENFAKNNPSILELNGAIYNELLSLYCEVLFIEDQKQKGKFHPRIAMQDTYSYNELDWQAKEALNRLYNHFFYERHNQFWAEQAMKKLPALLRATDMLVCAEDLGMIPACVPDVMRNLYMLSLEIDRMPKDPSQEFVYMDGVPYLSVCTTSTHDMSPIRGWWKEDMGLTQRYYNHVLGEWGGAPEDCEPWICEKILNRHLNSPAMLVILPFQDWISIDGENRRANCDEERINIPADPHHFWCYRMHKNVEELLGLTELNEKMLQMTINSGRSVKM